MGFTTLLVLLSIICVDGQPYSMYVWRDGWNPDSGCGHTDFLDWNNAACFSHTWDTADKRQWLWDTCNVAGREIDTLFFYDTLSALQTRDCASPGITWLIETLREGRSQVPGLQIYALFSDGGEQVPEQQYVADVVWYNTNCATDSNDVIDGVAVNNEDYQRNWPEAQKVAYLNNLHQIKLEADKQNPPGSLKAHYSVGWVWGQDDLGQEIEVTWNGALKPIMQHFIDIFDSLDVQVAFVTYDAMEERMYIAHWDYAQATGKTLHSTVYINKAFPCQTTFFPFPVSDPDCTSWSHDFETEAAMFAELDTLVSVLPGAKPCLHHFRGAYASGGYTGWPLPPVQ